MTVPFLPDAAPLPPLPLAAPATEHLARLLDALLVLQVHRSARVGDLARRVGLPPRRLRELLSSFMVAGADVVPPGHAPFNVSFDRSEGGVDDDVVRLSRARTGDAPLLDDVALRPTTVEEVARGLLSVQALLASGSLADRHRPAVEALAERLQRALHATVDSPVDEVTERLRSAVRDRSRVRFRYRDPWGGTVADVEVEPYDVRRHRDRMYLDAGPEPHTGWRTYDISAIAGLEVLQGPLFEPVQLPDRTSRERPLRVTFRVPVHSGAERRLLSGWRGLVAGPAGDGLVDVRVDVDGFDVAAKVGVLVLQLGPGCAVVAPEGMREAPRAVAQRLLALHPAQPPATAPSPQSQ